MKEPQVNYYVSADANIRKSFEFDPDRISIGNSFSTPEEAEKAVEKLKALKRLRDKGFKFEWWLSEPSSDHIEFYMDSFEWDNEATEDLNLLFEARNE